MSKRPAMIATLAALTLVVGAAFAFQPANAATTLDPIAVAQVQLANCQLLAAHPTSSAQRTRALNCVADQTAILKLLVPASPVPTGSSPVPTPTTVPPTTPPATTPPPTTVPPTTPAGIGSFATGPAGGAGAPPGTVFKPLSGAPQTGTTYDGYAIAGGTITASNLVLRNCTLGEVVFTGDNITVDHCTIRGGVSFSQNHLVVFNRNDLIGWSDCIHITEDGQNGVPAGLADHFTVTGNWCHSPGLKAPDDCAAHADGVQLLGVAGAVFSGNVIDLGHWFSCGGDPDNSPLNGAFQIENTQGPVSGVTVSGNLLNGGGFVFRAYAGTKLDAVTGNGFGPDEQFGPADTLQASIGTWSGNYVVATGAAVPRG